jgi:transposase-like protein
VKTRFLSEETIALREELEERQAVLAEMVNNDLTDVGKAAVRQTLEELMNEERDWVLGYVPHERLEEGTRPDHRNGYYERDLVTTFGVLPKVAVPRSRKGTYRTRILPRYRRRLKQVDRLIGECFLAGASTRRAGKLTGLLVGEQVSAQTVSRIAQSLDDHVRAFRRRALEDDLLYLFVDAVSMRIKGACGCRRQMLLVAVGITVEGRRKLIDFQLVARETKEHWQAFLENLWLRGLRGAQLECITSDGNPGLIGALQIVYPDVPRQRCWVHKMRNVTNKLKRAERKEAHDGMVRIYCAPTRAQALAVFHQWYRRWHPVDAEAADCLKRDLEALLTIFRLPPAHRIIMRTTNALERVFVEVRRRTRPMLAFVNDRSCERTCLSVFNYLQASWDRRPIRAITQKT